MILYIAIFLVGILELFLAVIDFKVTQRGRKIFSSIMTLILGIVEYVVIIYMVQSLQWGILAIIYCVGKSFGCYLGLSYEKQIDKFFFIKRRGKKKSFKRVLRKMLRIK